MGVKLQTSSLISTMLPFSPVTETYIKVVKASYFQVWTGITAWVIIKHTIVSEAPEKFHLNNKWEGT